MLMVVLPSRPDAPAPAAAAPAVSAPAVDPGSSVATALTLLAWTLGTLGVSAHDGEYSAWGLAALTVAFVLLLAVAALRRPLAAPSRWSLAATAAVTVVAAGVHPARRLMHAHAGGLLAVDLLAGLTALVALTAAAVVRRSAAAWAVGAALAAATGVVTVLVAADPHIDVWYLLQQSSSGLLHGDDMYRQHWQGSHGLQAVYPYLPFTTLALAPARWLLGDVRYALLGSSLLTSWQLRRLAPALPATLALLVLVHPHWAFLVDQSWTEPLLLVLLAAAVLALDRDRPGLAMLALAGALAAKQHVVLLLPLFALWPSFGWRRALGAGALAVLVVAPWLVAGPGDLWHDAVHANLALGVIPRAQCWPSFLLRHGVTVGFWFLLLVLAVAYAAVLVRVPRTPAGLALGSALVLLGLDLANKQSFFNHYMLPLGLLLVAVAAASSPARTRVGAVP